MLAPRCTATLRVALLIPIVAGACVRSELPELIGGGDAAPPPECRLSRECGSLLCDNGRCRNPVSCAEIHAGDVTLPDGVYTIYPPTLEPTQVHCDMTTADGGWTLVASTLGQALRDEGSAYYDDLTRLVPTEGHTGVWGGLRLVIADTSDIRFSCKLLAADNAMTVDLVFIQTLWYRTITTGADNASCFHAGGFPGPRFTPPARFDLMASTSQPRGDGWAGGLFRGEDNCGDTGDFTVDFEAGGMDRIDPTDWGSDDGQRFCSTLATDQAAYFIWVREAVPSCTDGLLDGDETAVDCGGFCPACADDANCGEHADCLSGVCVGTCRAGTCDDQVHNGDETAPDCGGSCPPCALDVRCAVATDCQSGVCNGTCRAPVCSDAVPNGLETGIDCGGPCVPCADLWDCLAPDDCESGVCIQEICVAPTCSDGVHNGGETGRDCGGGCVGCALDADCAVDVDCAGGVCSGGRCAIAACGNLVRDIGETDIDCGGATCGPCAVGDICGVNSDCDGLCDNSICREPLSCDELHSARPALPDGVYRIRPALIPVLVYCDMSVDDGGWTLVASSLAVLKDKAAAYHSDLTTLFPQSLVNGVWDGMRVAAAPLADLRFSCRWDARSRVRPMDVDLSFYAVPWYDEVTTGLDAESCFSENDGAGYDTPAPARRNNRTGDTRPIGDDWDQGYLEGEDTCGDTADFIVDFDDRGMDSSLDGTDWGEDDGGALCQTLTPYGAWFIWLR